ncbi:MAG: quinone-dependent dihydroorotate dehydrogenase [Bacteroidia bacterium]
MYKLLIRPLLFLFDPEAVHHFSFKFLKIFLNIPLIKQLVKNHYTVTNKRLETEVFGLKFPSPIGLAAGFDKDALLYNELSNFGFGFIEIGSLTPKAQQGNLPKRLFRLKKDEALINRMGFNNKGVDAAVRRLKNRKTNIIIGGNIGKNTLTIDEKADYIYCFKALHHVVDYFVVNVSCPNVGKMEKLQSKDFLMDLLSELKQINNTFEKPKPILLKIAPDLNQTQLDEVIEVIIATKTDGVIATNTSISRENLSTSEYDLNRIGNGGLSGKPLTKTSTEVIKYLHQKSNGAFPIIGVGGIHSAEDALEKLNAGATLVQVYTGFIYEGPSLVKQINKAILKRRSA